MDYNVQAVHSLREQYKLIKAHIKSSLQKFDQIGRSQDLEILFIELVFCLFTPQSNAHSCWKAVQSLHKSRILWTGSEEEFYLYMKGVRFHKTKAKRVVQARQNIWIDKNFDLRACLALQDETLKRETLNKNVKGLGWKECSHYLRNTGNMQDLAILDRHILRNMLELRIISELPNTLSKQKYLELESALQRFSLYAAIPMLDLDLIFWYRSQGELFK